jgi:hypothetical protein
MSTMEDPSVVHLTEGNILTVCESIAEALHAFKLAAKKRKRPGAPATAPSSTPILH